MTKKIVKKSAKKSIKPAQKKRVGRPTKYNPKYNQIVENVCREWGAIDEQIAKMMGVAVATITNWKKNHPEFLASVKRGKDYFDTKNVEDSLLRRALGYDYQEEHIEKSNNSGIERISKKIIKKHLAPDPTSMIFFLKNRNPERWRDRQDFNHSVSGGVLVVPGVATDPEAFEKVIMKQQRELMEGDGYDD